MGCDIHGLVEVNWYGDMDHVDDKKKWECAIENIGSWVGRSYDTFGLLFGVRDYANFEPVAPRRGVPDNLSNRGQERIGKDKSWCHSFSYVTLAELNQVDWEATADEADSRIRVYDEEDELRFKAAGISSLSDEEEQKIRSGDEVVKELDNGQTNKYRLEKMKKKDALSGAWKRLIDLMESFGETHGEENVRLVVWFDN
mgnify:CR=1 FL=1